MKKEPEAEVTAVWMVETEMLGDFPRVLSTRGKFANGREESFRLPDLVETMVTVVATSILPAGLVGRVVYLFNPVYQKSFVRVRFDEKNLHEFGVGEVRVCQSQEVMVMTPVRETARR